MSDYILVCICARCGHEWITRKTHIPKICASLNCGTKFWLDDPKRHPYLKRQYQRSIFAPALDVGGVAVLSWPLDRSLLVYAVRVWAGRKGFKFKNRYGDAGLEITRSV